MDEAIAEGEHHIVGGQVRKLRSLAAGRDCESENEREQAYG